jgi:hypothetical protein
MSTPHASGVWISADFASVVRWSGDVALHHRIESTVAGRHRSTGRPPTESHPAGEGHRDEHMRTFFAQVAHVLRADDDLLLLGDGEVVEHFAEQLRADDQTSGRTRRIEVEKGGPLTERQLVARTRTFAGYPAKRRLPR